MIDPESSSCLSWKKVFEAMDTEKAGPLENKAFLRHVRQYVHAPSHRFAAIVPPEFSTLCRDELTVLGFSQTGISEAGVEFTEKLAGCYAANLWLRTASRILCRLPSFRAGATEELFHKVSAMRWELWLNPEIPLRVSSYVEHSRIEHEGVVADTFLDGVRKRFIEQGLPAPTAWRPPAGGQESDVSISSWLQRVIVRLDQNRCEISLDTTGPHLHERGYRLHHTGAPLRETLAAAILRKAGWKGDAPLIDGMCGSGTFGIEAALIARRLPPGLGRHFLFEKWPSFQSKTWEYMVRKAAEGAFNASPVPIVCVDRDLEAVSVARENSERAGVHGDVRLECTSFFDIRPRAFGLTGGLLVLNPPYGIRIKEDVDQLYQRLGNHISTHFNGWQAAVLAPSRSLATYLKIRSPRLWRVDHGGTPVVVVMGKCS